MNQKYYQKIRLTDEALIELYYVLGYQGESYYECIRTLLDPILDHKQIIILSESVKELNILFKN